MEIKGIYSITNTINNKKYIGSSINVKGRLRQHRSDLKNNNHYNYYLQRSVNKYGLENFIFSPIYVVSQDISDIELRQLENKFCEQYNTYNNKFGYNLVIEDGTSRELTPDGKKRHRDKMREVHGVRAVLVDIKTHDKMFFETVIDASRYMNCSSLRFMLSSVADGYLHIRESDLNQIDDLHKFISSKVLYTNTPPGSPIPVLDVETGVYYNSIREVCQLYGFAKANLIDYKSYRNFVVCAEGVTNVYDQQYKDKLSRALGNSLYKATTSILDLETGIYYYGYNDARATFGITKNLAKKFFTNNPRFLVETLSHK